MRNYPDELAALEEAHATLSTAHTEAQNRIADLERENTDLKQRMGKTVDLEKDNEALRHALEHYQREERHREAADDKQREVMRGFDAGG